MPDGGCACGNVRFNYTGEPQMKAICHCMDCRKISGSTYSTNIIVDGSTVKITRGTPKKWTKTADSGREITSTLCGECGSTLYREGPAFGTGYVIKVGAVDDPKVMEVDGKPGAELYAGTRPSWVKSVEGADDVPGMPM